MRQSRVFAKTLREDPADSDTASHRLMVRAAMIDQLAAGLYTMLPLGLRAQRRLEGIVREEMDGAGALEVQMPVLQPAEIWRRSGRDVAFAEVLFRLSDKRERPHVLGPTHEEVVTRLVAQRARSHRDLPVTLYQVHTKHRDELRPRAGLLRVREFIMKDAYSFDATEDGLDESYALMERAYRRIFERCALDVVPVQADSGAIGGKESVEFVLPCDAGEDTIVRCTRCDYAANTERAVFSRGSAPGSEPQPLEEVSTPGVKTIEALARFLGIAERQTAKAVFYTSVTGDASQLVFVVIRGDIPVNEVKLKNYLGCDALRLAGDDEVRAAGLVAGSASPVGLGGIRTIADLSVPLLANAVAGGNRPDVHLKNVNFGRDFQTDEVVDIGTARAGDACERCGGELTTARGMELGHIFKLGTRYTTAFDASYLDADGRERSIWMGCYGIGVGRTLAAVVEAHHDERGIVWPAPVAPYDVHLVALNVDNPEVKSAAERVYAELSAAHRAVLYDDRVESPGVKFNDADLIGLPVRITVGPRGLREGVVEVRDRASGGNRQVPLTGVLEGMW
ncbi:MAG TPA: proline--tRNA ligase [Chloroflexota bacterium]|nr:proline--tRNA ligase [Chloroflexota bacterium]